MFSGKSLMMVMQRLIGSWYLLMSADCQKLFWRKKEEKKKKSWQCRDLYLAGTMRGALCEWYQDGGVKVESAEV